MGRPKAKAEEPGASDLTLDELRPLLATQIAASAMFDGWSDTALLYAAESTGVDADVARLAFPGGSTDMIEAWVATIDAAMVMALPAEKLATMKVRDRIRAQVVFRLEAMAGLEESLRRAHSVMAMPQNLHRALAIGWRSADLMWRQAGDTATDYNHYTKRTLLGGIYAATLAVFVDDDSEGKSATHAFLNRRIEGVMRFEKAKARLLDPQREHFSVVRFLGRLRYPAR